MTKKKTNSTRISHIAGGREWQVLVPEGFEGEPTSVVDVLKRALAALVAEGEWMRGNWFINAHPEVDPEDAFCNDWRACADGFILVVTQGAHRRIGSDTTWGRRWHLDENAMSRDGGVGVLVLGARTALRTAANAALPQVMGGSGFYGVPMINDHYCPTRRAAVEWFTQAVALAEHEATTQEDNT